MGPRSITLLDDQGRPGLNRLFFGYPVSPTRQQAVDAIDAYLSGSQHPWRNI